MTAQLDEFLLYGFCASLVVSVEGDGLEEGGALCSRLADGVRNAPEGRRVKVISKPAIVFLPVIIMYAHVHVCVSICV